jgi:uracil-DNA glycosylase family 4
MGPNLLTMVQISQHMRVHIKVKTIHLGTTASIKKVLTPHLGAKKMLSNPNCPHIKNGEKCFAIPGRGSKTAPIVIVGMNPGQQEIKENSVFVGPSGKLLSSFLEELGIKDVYITNAIKCFFPIGTEPELYIESWRDILLEEIKEINPKVIIALGAVSVKSLLPQDGKESIKRLRERIHYLYNIPLLVSYHPSALLRSGSESSELYPRLREDLKWAYKIAYGESAIKDIPINYRILNTKEDVIACLEHLASTGKVTAIDFETNTRLGKSLWAYDANPLTVSLSQEEGVSYGIPLAHPQSPFINSLPWLYTVITTYLRDMKLVAHNCSFENACFSRWFPGVKATEDTLLMAKVLNEFEKHDLHTLTNQYTSIASHKEYYLAHPDIENDEMPLEHLLEANLADTDATIRLYNKFSKELDENDQKFYKEYLMGKFVPVVDHMISNGIKIDLEYIRSIIPYYIKMEREFVEAGKDMFGVSISSPLQKAKLLQDLGFILPHTVTKKNGTKVKNMDKYSTDKEAVKHARVYCLKEKLPILDFFERYNDVHYLNTYYLNKIFNWVGKDGRAHPWYNVFGAARTGRMSSTDFNAQNLKKGSDFKKACVAENWYISFDFSAFEFKIFAMFMKDQSLITKFKQGIDIHQYHASKIFNRPAELVTPEERQIAKGAVSFAVLFGAGAATVARQSGTDIETAGRTVNWFKSTYPSVRQYHDWTTNETKQNGYFLSPLGRKWHSSNSSFSQTVNKPIQGTANFGCLLASHDLITKGFKLVQNVHDSITLEFAEQPTAEDIYEVYQTCKNVVIPGFEEFAGLLDGELSIGRNLLEMTKI